VKIYSDFRIAPKQFFSRLLFLFFLLSCIQLFHLTVLSEVSLSNILVLSIIFIIGSIFLTLLVSRINYSIQWPSFNVDLFTSLLVLTFLITILFSRLSYIVDFFEFGMYQTRNMGLGTGGWYSFFTIFFYPLSIILAFVNIRRNRYYTLFSLVLVVAIIDLVILGTRGIPIFILLFHILMLRINFLSYRSMFFLFSIIVIFVFVFDYQTQARSLNTVTVGWDWERTISYSWIFDNLRIKDSVFDFFSNSFNSGFPVIYISQYLSHSIAEFNNLLSLGTYDLLGDMLYFKGEYCLVARCDRSEIFYLINEVNPRAGLYQTLYSSLLIDFGFLGVLVIILPLLIYILWANVGSTFLSIAVYVGLIMSVSGVENYIYNGLGLARMLIFFVLWKFLTTKFKFNEKEVLVS